METRRRLLRLVGASATVTAIAGCTDGGSGPGGTDESGENGDTAGSPDGSDGTDEADLGVQGRDLGESVTFTNGDNELRLAATSVRLTDLLVGAEYASLASLTPEDPWVGSDADDLFLLVELQVENTGSTTYQQPLGFRFETAEGTEHERVAFEEISGLGFAFPIRQQYGQLQAGAERTMWIGFPVPADTAAGRLVADLDMAAFDPEPEAWALDLSSVTPETHDFGTLDVGEGATVGDSSLGLRATVRNVREETGQFETTYSGNEFEYDAPPEGEKYVLVDFALENVSTRQLGAIRPYKMTLRGDGWEEENASYTADDTYHRGTYQGLDPGETKAGILLYTVPADANPETFAVEMTSHVTLTWSLN
ncbi:DUF4352 domain-containing protein [Halorientalis pallida]|uniref:DUF4352 domain-containing protein n=1 Tax=Halorientalis pallida TaxID=2479928 RepID=UPI003C6F83CB